MRVIAGEAKGIRLQSLRGTGTRPTADRVKEAMFSVLQPRIHDARVLDLFSGSGALGIEALSRGAAAAVHVEVSRPAVRIIKQNVARAGLADRSQVWCLDAFAAIKRLFRQEDVFDIILADPPYGRGDGQRVLNALSQMPLLKTSGVLVIEHNHKEELTIVELNFKLEAQRGYGDTALSLYRPVVPRLGQ